MTWLIFIIGAAIAGFIQGLTGFAFGLVAMSFWVWVLPMQLAAPLVVIASLWTHLIALLGERKVRQHFDYHLVWPYLSAGLIGVPCGIYILQFIAQDQFRLVLGLFLVLWSICMLWQPQWQWLKTANTSYDRVIGFMAGILGGLGGLCGALPSAWMMLKALPKDQQRYISRHFNFGLQLFTLLGYLLAGQLNAISHVYLLVLAVSVMLPSYLGTRLFYQISEPQFKRILLVLLLSAGVLLILRSALAH